MRIWKFPVPIQDGWHQVIEVPEGARFLDAQIQDGAPCVWALVDPKANRRRWHFHWIGTGDDVPDDIDYGDGDVYIATVQMGAFVFHLFHSGYEITADEAQ